MDFKKLTSILKSQGFTYVADVDGFHLFGPVRAGSLGLRTKVALDILKFNNIEAKEQNGAILVKKL